MTAADGAAAFDGPALDEMTDDEIIGERVEIVIRRKRIQQADLAALLGMHQSTLSNKLRGKRPFFAREILVIAAALDVDPAFLLGYAKAPTPEGEGGGPDAGAEKSLLSGSNRRSFAYKAHSSHNNNSPCAVVPLRRTGT